MARANATNPSAIRLPKLCHHKGKNLSFARHRGKFFYFGPAGDPETESKYRQWCAELITGGAALSRDTSTAVTVNELLDAYERDRERRGGVQTYAAIGIRYLRDLYGHERADSIGPKRLKLLLAVMAGEQAKTKPKYTRSTINSTLSSVKSIFQWGTSEEMVPPTVWQALKSVSGLRANDGGREPRKVLPVDDTVFEKTLEQLPLTLQAVLRLLKLTGARPSELLTLTPGMVDKSGDIWTAELCHHKNAHRGKVRVLHFGPKAQEILKPFLLRGANEPCFNALEGFRQWNEDKPNHRHQPNAEPVTERRIGSAYNKDTLGRAVARACDKAGVPRWFPYMLRHNCATEARRVGGLDAAQCALGHSGANVTQRYAELDRDKAAQVARQIG